MNWVGFMVFIVKVCFRSRSPYSRTDDCVVSKPFCGHQLNRFEIVVETKKKLSLACRTVQKWLVMRFGTVALRLKRVLQLCSAKCKGCVVEDAE